MEPVAGGISGLNGQEVCNLYQTMNTLDPVHQRYIDGYCHDELLLLPRIFPPEKTGSQTKMVKKATTKKMAMCTTIDIQYSVDHHQGNCNDLYKRASPASTLRKSEMVSWFVSSSTITAPHPVSA